jgi:DNA-directed RNA polymerase subunit RPC12/RpoP
MDRKTKKELGICKYCDEKAEIGRICCLVHLQRWNESQRKKSRENINAGKCGCGRDKDPQFYRCDRCKEQNRLQYKRRVERRREEGKCVRCGRPLGMLERTDVTKCINCMEESLEFNWK